MAKLDAHLALVTVLTLSQAFAAPNSIGTVSAHGSIQVDGSNVYGNATVFDGTLIETGKATTDLRLQQGAELLLAIDSRGKLYGDRLVLEKGATEIRKAGAIRLEANNLRIIPADATSKGLVLLKASGRVDVTAASGAFNVTTQSGALLAKVVPGLALEFDGQAAGAVAPITVNGIVSKEDGRIFLTTSAGVKYELTGKNLEGMVGKTRTLTGTPDPNAAPHLGATTVLLLSGSRPLAAGAAGAGAGTGTGATATGGAAGGAAAGGGLSGATIGLITAASVAGGVGLGVGVYEATKSNASR